MTCLGADLPGFIPLREDFDVEHANDAELLLAEMEFNVDDHPSERELKLKVVTFTYPLLSNIRLVCAGDRDLQQEVGREKSQEALCDRQRTNRSQAAAAGSSTYPTYISIVSISSFLCVLLDSKSGAAVKRRENL